MGTESDSRPYARADTKAAAGLHLVATPIGNLGDITLRALDVLTGADMIVCEDTRVTRKLLSRYAIATPSLAYNDHNARRVLPGLMGRLKNGDSLALVTDAGTPLISDPGYRLVEAAIEADIKLHTLPGASAALAGLVLSGLPTDGFFFAGFPPPRQAARRRRFTELSAVPGSLVFFESARRLAASLSDLHHTLGDRPAAIAREITKLHEEVRRGSLSELAAHYADAGPPRGEIVIVVAPPLAQEVDTETLRTALADALGDLSLRDAVAQVTADTGRPRREVYRLALEITGDEPDS
ncbi:MAG: 16S rRNA (cytidine(1402)-2'-O)-methyltransferase [Rhodospirillaceae bacterium]|nr:16S rRNA (cytidine(1402)-2'-O)-methyltransferase [Rhodospirillaceae bacterium]MBT5943942.1 16S rRNA (cytidine(1402)-2'-O)-methyltransferase [Rhodospirillaceae bacterium]MBT6405533.1 16S rRNA (cytidine(1402)-2'-O)-methyltransferase [Rhodospirillaceae bacterium]MBT6537012.1 16S rRNA (cytidine(1402)-2'-O)-methyltransferase [Rhodospirillaceae bacterium]MBT7362356.1 16S rRNA (cytidine(1402)-2'-O)-methyltransferase [Rhodospirillaceae bacterium]